MLASKSNMRKHYKQGIAAFSYETGEIFSADPGDYWDSPEDMILKDSEGNNMILVRRVETIVPLMPVDEEEFD